MHENQLPTENCWKAIGVWSNAAERCPKLAQLYHCRNCDRYTSAGRQLLNRSLPLDYQYECTELLAEVHNERIANAKTAFVFRVGKEWLALPTPVIREVVDMAPIHSIPHISSNIIRGLINIRGKLEVCVSIGAVLGIERNECADDKQNYIAHERVVIAICEGQALAFPVSEIHGVIRYREDSLREMPVTVSGSKAVFTNGILCLGDKDIGFLKDQPLFRTLTRNLT
jgi:chemotaxis-related protein WspD